MERSEQSRRRSDRWRVLAAAGAITALAAWWLWPRDPVPLAPQEASAAGDAKVQPATAPTDGDTPSATRAGANERANAAPASSPTFAFECTLTSCDEYNLPVLAAADLGPMDGAVLPYSSGFEGVGLDRRYRWSATASQGTVVVESGLLRTIPLLANRPVQVAVGAGLFPPSPITGPLAEFDIGDQLDRVFGPRVAPAVAFVNASGLRGWSGSSVYGRSSSHASYGVLRGTVLTPLGEPARDFAVRMGHERASIGANGTFAFKQHLVGKYRVDVGSRDGSTLQTEITIREGSTTVTLQLVANPAVRGRVVTPAGKPLANARLVWSTDAGDYNNHALARDDGSFVVPSRTAGAGALWACVPGDSARWPAAGGAAHTYTPTDLVVDAASCKGSVHLTTPPLADLPPRTVSARLWQQASGYGMRLVCTRAGENGCEFAAIDLPAGYYRLELLAPAFGVVDGGTFWCDGQQAVDLGRAALPLLCDVTVELPPGTAEPSAFEFVRVNSVFPSRLHTELGIAATHRLAAGDYELWWRSNARAAPQSLAFTIPRGTTTLTLRLR